MNNGAPLRKRGVSGGSPRAQETCTLGEMRQVPVGDLVSVTQRRVVWLGLGGREGRDEVQPTEEPGSLGHGTLCPRVRPCAAAGLGFPGQEEGRGWMWRVPGDFSGHSQSHTVAICPASRLDSRPPEL